MLFNSINFIIFLFAVVIIYYLLPKNTWRMVFLLDAAIDRFAPHYGEFAEIDSLFALNGWKEKVKLLSKAYRYNSKFVQTIK